MSFIKYIFQFFPTLVEFRNKSIIAVLKAFALVLVGLVGMIFVIGVRLFWVGLRVLSIILTFGALSDFQIQEKQNKHFEDKNKYF
jgi:ABC-type bacteriocin/lantibiotic exporter with double-glycine peptidase domain